MTKTINTESTIQQYYFLKEGQLTPYGPVPMQELSDMVNNSELTANDYVFHTNWEFWKRIGEVFSIPHEVAYAGDHGQDPFIVEEAFNYINSNSLKGEELFYIAVQSVPSLKITSSIALNMPKAVILTNYRICIFEKRIAGDPHTDSYPINYIESVTRKLRQGNKKGTLTLTMKSADWIEINRLPASQLTELVNASRTVLENYRNLKQRKQQQLQPDFALA